MLILIVSSPRPSMGGRIPDDPLAARRLLGIGGPISDEGHDVTLIEFTSLDREFSSGAHRATSTTCGPMGIDEVVARIALHRPDILMLGSVSGSAHPIAVDIAARAKQAVDGLLVIYGGAFPTDYWCDVLRDCPAIDLIVRGEHEETCRDLIAALCEGRALESVSGIAFRRGGRVHATTTRPTIGGLGAGAPLHFEPSGPHHL